MNGGPQTEIRTVGARELGYDVGFRQMLESRPGITRSALSLLHQAEEAYNPSDIQVLGHTLSWNKEANNWMVSKSGEKEFDKPLPLGWVIHTRGAYMKEDKPFIDPQTGLEVTILGKSTRLLGQGPDRVDETTYARMRLVGESSDSSEPTPDFFVKKSVATGYPAFPEFVHSKQAQEALRDIPDLNIVEAQLGYSDKKQSLFVSKWVDLENRGFFPSISVTSGDPNDYGQPSALDKVFDEDDDVFIAFMENHSSKIEAMKAMISTQMQEAGLTIGDLEQNLFYNPDTGKFFLLDVTVDVGKKINQGRAWEARNNRHK